MANTSSPKFNEQFIENMSHTDFIHSSYTSITAFVRLSALGSHSFFIEILSLDKAIIYPVNLSR
ncbi:hypothetical protein [Anabaena lutea]|uniref:C2 domain-containing protein n=1 Tax=Anabaena lutea FACHB-196 TaxID=2692881 RepID=A0ABR8FI44_9NOST|nr:hypothetical protein [Anabaena lutea]MBD2569288.1 hypothetical protein [Anabaena lutea FACHB-196]